MFKPGDKVKCVRAVGSADILIRDNIYSVVKEHEYMTEYYSLEGVEFVVSESYLELYTESDSMDNLKEGDKLICVYRDDIGDSLVKGGVYTFKKYTTDKKYVYVKEVKTNKNIFKFERYKEPVPEVEPVRVKPKVIYRIPRLVKTEE